MTDPALWKRFACDESGVSAVEFALILPIMLVILLGAVATGNAIEANRKTTTVASIIGDLTAQAKSLTPAQVDDIFAAADAIFEPFDANNSTLVVSSIRNDNGQAKVTWSRALRTSDRADNSTVTLPDGILTTTTTVIMAEVTYQHTMVLGGFINDSITMRDTFYMRPRRVVSIPCTGC